MDQDNNPCGNQFDIESGEESRIEPSPTEPPVEKNDRKPRRRLVKKSATKSLSECSENTTKLAFGGEYLDDWKEVPMKKRKSSPGNIEKDLDDWKEVPVKKRKSSPGNIEKDLSVKNNKKVLRRQNQSGGKASSSGSNSYEVADLICDPDLQEFWNYITGEDLQGEDDNETNEYLKIGENMIKVGKLPVEIAMIVEDLMAQFKVTVEEDFELHMQNKLAINKLKMLPLLQEALSKEKLQPEFLDQGILIILKSWLEPLSNGCLPDMTIRTAILQLLSDFDLEQCHRWEQLKKSGLDKVVIFLSKSDEESEANKKLAKMLVDKWEDKQI